MDPQFYSELKHNMLRRAIWHDYHLPCVYLITLMKKDSPEVPFFSSIIKKEIPAAASAAILPGGSSAVEDFRNVQVSTDFSWSGWAVYNGIRNFSRLYHDIKIIRYVIMPDHVHIIIYVSIKTDMSLGTYVRHLKTLCTQAFISKAFIRNKSVESVFEPGFNDRILFSNREDQMQNWINYIIDNPKRLYIKRSNPNFFSTTAVVDSDKLPASLWPSGKKPLLQLCGNRFLLRYPDKTWIKYSRKFSAEEWQKKKGMALRAAENGGVLISPFIHSEEKAIEKEGLQLGGRIIKIVADGFLPRAKPQGADFYHCAEGRMLIAAMNEGVFSPTPCQRNLCNKMNELALWLTNNADILI